MRRAFIRTIWGNCLKEDGIKATVLKDVFNERNNCYRPDFVVYVFGGDNLSILSRLGFNCVLLHEDPIVYDMKTQLWRHKLDVFKAAMEDYDEICFLDWDCIALDLIPERIWDGFHMKDKIQANLMLYRTKRCLWRSEDVRKTCNGGFVYMRDKNAPDGILKAYDEIHEWVKEQEKKRKSQGKELRFREKALIFDDEPAITKYIDEYMGGWQGLDYYWKNFEPEYCNIKKSAFDRELLNTKTVYFKHWV